MQLAVPGRGQALHLVLLDHDFEMLLPGVLAPLSRLIGSTYAWIDGKFGRIERNGRDSDSKVRVRTRVRVRLW